jgi:hypothetical protein
MSTINLQDVKPTPLIGLAKLMRMAFSGTDLAPLGAQLIERAQTHFSADTLMDLSMVLQLRGNRDLALLMQAEAIGSRQIYTPPTASGPVNIRICAVMSTGDLMANTPLEFLLEDSDVALNLVYVVDSNRMKNASEDDKRLYGAADVGFIAQNVYLYCASQGLAVVVRGSIDRRSLSEAMKLRPEQRIILAQTVGYPN